MADLEAGIAAVITLVEQLPSEHREAIGFVVGALGDRINALREQAGQ